MIVEEDDSDEEVEVVKSVEQPKEKKTLAKNSSELETTVKTFKKNKDEAGLVSYLRDYSLETLSSLLLKVIDTDMIEYSLSTLVNAGGRHLFSVRK